jgi:hypothetical protein
MKFFITLGEPDVPKLGNFRQDPVLFPKWGQHLLQVFSEKEHDTPKFLTTTVKLNDNCVNIEDRN